MCVCVCVYTADLHYDNVMVLGDSVSGLLDFEVCDTHTHTHQHTHRHTERERDTHTDIYRAVTSTCLHL